jgi:ATP-dependent Clp protease ATP-binding subunit ClpC
MMEGFSNRLRNVMALANEEARRFNHDYVGTDHILLGLVKEGSGTGAKVLKNLNVDLRKVQLEVEKLLTIGPEMANAAQVPKTPLAKLAKKVIEYAIEEAHNLNHNYVGTEHILLGLLREQEGAAFEVLCVRLGFNLEDVRSEVARLRGSSAEEAELRDASWSSRSVHRETGGTVQPLTLLIDPGTATPSDLATLFTELSTLYRMLGGSGVTFKLIDAREPITA